MLNLYGRKFSSRLMLGTAQYPSPAILRNAIHKSNIEIVTVSLRRETAGGKQGGQFWQFLKELDITVLPNTAGCYTVKEAVTTAQLARDLFKTSWIKLEIIGNPDTLQPNVFSLIEAAQILNSDGFQIFAYTTDDLIVAERLLDVGCRVIMPWCAPIGSGQGPHNTDGLRSIRAYLPDVTLVIDAGIGRPSHAAVAMELGYDAVLLNTAVAKAGDPVLMAQAFAQAVQAGRMGYKAGILKARNIAVPSTPIVGKAVFS
ncbi:thiazole synthase [Bartonella quintana]|uniref:Thiazole synthase n=3 Tax=Bartonella quintana TaxID=803 RepID=THIG_BARQU|nr:thiazole synthase [Bartonella quintana]Q6G0A2.1 RecName: Full=Thiazole synthase [Bartonella quintana str. Toulouse]ETS11697.1 thiazole synthase [Bartonella quintana BQ2-D70]ETS14504.1 thiazole synthase [Bartonella quintana JK 73rel]ETS16190.1 thiazole synthase [Bartonella quintana JK 73]ETS18192.1 thiazole synthase [Bartonella quintana JK 7]ETS19021.1 thiazole synthase [Bartonella quintana JK 12]